MITSQETGEIAAAMAKAQEKIENPTKHKTAKVRSDKGNYDYMYTDLAAGLECIRPVLSAQSIAVFQVPTTDRNGNIILLTRLIHSSGQWVEGEYFVCKTGDLLTKEGTVDHQKRGSALTYARRHSLFAIVGIAGADDDDDGKSASISSNGDRVQRIESQLVSNDQAKLIRDKIAAAGADVAKFLAFFKVDSVVNLRSSQFREAMTLLSAKKISAKEAP